MTRRICLLGNSHIAALRDAVEKSPHRWPDVSFTFVAAHKNRLLDTTCRDGQLVPLDAQTRESFAAFGKERAGSIDLDAHDALVITGCEMAASRAAFLYREARWAALPSVSSMRGEDAAEAPWQLVSEAAFAAMLQTMLLETLAGRLARHLRRGTATPILVASQPRTARGVLDVGKHPLDVLGHIIDAGDAAEVSRAFEDSAEVLCAALDATFLPQPFQTIDRQVLTKPAFTNGAIRLTRDGRQRQPRGDFLHANAAYGTLVLDQIVATVDAAHG